jgi:hypothetical protein
MTPNHERKGLMDRQEIGAFTVLLVILVILYFVMVRF